MHLVQKVLIIVFDRRIRDGKFEGGLAKEQSVTLKNI